MPWKPFRIDESITDIESRQSTPIADGDYVMTPQKAVPCKEEWLNTPKSDGGEKKPYWQIHFKIEKGKERVGSTYTEFVSFSEGAMFRLGQIYAAIGGDPAKLVNKEFPSYQSFAQFAAAITAAFGKTNKPIGLLITSRVNSGKTQNQIAELFPAEDYEKRTQYTQTPAAAAAALPPSDDASIEDLLGGPTL